MDIAEHLTMAQEDKTSRQSQRGDVIKRRQSFKRPRDNEDTDIAVKLTSAGRLHRKEASSTLSEVYMIFTDLRKVMFTDAEGGGEHHFSRNAALRVRSDKATTTTTPDSTSGESVTTSGSLPLIDGQHEDPETVSIHTVSKIVAGNQTAPNVKVTVVDCRYPYEYEGGHIKGAVNLYERSQVHRLLKHRRPSPETTEILVFHCEFSCQRGPALCQYLRSEDRAMNAENYPRLTFPEVYIMEGGYKHFYTNYKELCDPAGYTPMLHQDHRSELRNYRGKSKSRTLEEKKRNLTMTPKAIRF